MAQIVNGLLVKNGQVLMALRSPARRSYPDTWSFPGGHVEKGETLKCALARELSEEIGIQVDTQTYLQSVQVRSADKAKPVTFYFFVVESWHGQLQNLGQEHSELRWVNFAEAASLPKLALPCYTQLLSTLSSKSF